MAYTVNQTSTGLRGTYDELIFVVNDDTNTGEEKYRYACAVTIDSTQQAVLRQLPNNADSAVFNVRNVAAQFVHQDEGVIELGRANTVLLSTNSTAFKTATMRFGYAYATSADAEPTLTLLPATDQSAQLVNGNFTLATSALLDSDDDDAYVPTANTKFWLSDTPEVNGLLINYVLFDGTKRSYSTLAFINTTASSATHIGVRYYNGQTTLSTTVYANSTANGGKPPSTVTTDSQRLLYFGVGTANLGGQLTSDINPDSSTNDGWTHYDVVLGSSTDPFTDAVSKTYRFVKLDCTRFQTADDYYTVHWWNSKGGYDSLVFSGKSEVTQSMQRQGFRQIGGNSFDADGDTTDYVKNAYEGGMTQAHIRTKTTLNLNTAFGDPDRLSPLMMSLVNSERVYVSPARDFGLNANQTNSSGYVRAYVQDNNFTNRTSVKDGLTSFALQLEVSRYRPTR